MALLHALLIGEPDHRPERRQNEQRDDDQQRKARALDILFILGGVEHANVVRSSLEIGHGSGSDSLWFNLAPTCARIMAWPIPKAR